MSPSPPPPPSPPSDESTCTCTCFKCHCLSLSPSLPPSIPPSLPSLPPSPPYRIGLIEEEDLPICICTLTFPSQMYSLHIHVYDPHYRLMVRRCIESNSRGFGDLGIWEGGRGGERGGREGGREGGGREGGERERQSLKKILKTKGL